MNVERDPAQGTRNTGTEPPRLPAQVGQSQHHPLCTTRSIREHPFQDRCIGTSTATLSAKLSQVSTHLGTSHHFAKLQTYAVSQSAVPRTRLGHVNLVPLVLGADLDLSLNLHHHPTPSGHGETYNSKARGSLRKRPLVVTEREEQGRAWICQHKVLVVVDQKPGSLNEAELGAVTMMGWTRSPSRSQTRISRPN